jgi:hypothetical protein
MTDSALRVRLESLTYKCGSTQQEPQVEGTDQGCDPDEVSEELKKAEMVLPDDRKLRLVAGARKQAIQGLWVFDAV